MSKKMKYNPTPVPVELKETRHTIQNAKPNIQWQTFEQCWNACVKNGTPLLMVSCKAHVRALGWLNQPQRWLEGIQHFGVEVEKK